MWYGIIVMTKFFSSIACNLDANILLAILPLFQSEKVQAIEWSFDTLFKVRDIPPWYNELLHVFSKEGRLIGHGVYFSLFSGKWSPEQQNWLNRLEQLSSEFQFDHVTEHFGFMTGKDFHKGAPISIPFNSTTLAIGQDRLKRIYQACKCPVGLENLAISYSIEEVKRHGEFLNELIESVNGFIILDLHNLFCQLHNFEIDYEDLIKLYPLEKVREIHISGGSWEDSMIEPDKVIRRDTHDDSVPEEVFVLLEKTIDRCPNLKFVVLEQLGTGLKTEESRTSFQNDFFRMDKIVQQKNKDLPFIEPADFLPKEKFNLSKPIEDIQLYHEQLALSNILETARDLNHVNQLLQKSALVNSDWGIEQWKPHMLETVMLIAQKWKKGF